MTAARIHHTAKPVTGYAPLQPMSDSDRQFWQILRSRAQPMQPEPRSLLARWFFRKVK